MCIAWLGWDGIYCAGLNQEVNACTGEGMEERQDKSVTGEGGAGGLGHSHTVCGILSSDSLKSAMAVPLSLTL